MSKSKSDYYVIATIEIDMLSMTEKQAASLVRRLNKSIDMKDKIETYVTRQLPDNCKAGFMNFDAKTLNK